MADQEKVEKDRYRFGGIKYTLQGPAKIGPSTPVFESPGRYTYLVRAKLVQQPSIPQQKVPVQQPAQAPSPQDSTADPADATSSTMSWFKKAKESKLFKKILKGSRGKSSN